MPAGVLATVPDWGLLSACGLAAADERVDGLAQTSGLMRMDEEVGGKQGRKWEGGARYPRGVLMYAATGVSSMPSGYEAYDNTIVEPERVAYFNLALSGLLMKIGLKEMIQYGNSPNNALKRKIESLTQSCIGFLHREWTKRSVGGLGSGFTDWGTLNGFDVTAGVFESGAAGSGQSHSIGGLSKSTYAFAIGWNNVVVNLGNAFGTNQHNLFQLLARVKNHKDGGKKAWLASTQAMVNLKRAALGYEQYSSKDPLDMGRAVEVYQGIKIYQEPQMPVSTATGGSATNTNPISFYLLDNDDIFYAWARDVAMAGHSIKSGRFGVGQWGPINGQTGVFGCPVLTAGNLIVGDMGSSGVAYGGETY